MLMTTIVVLDVVGLLGGAYFLWKKRPNETPSFSRDVVRGMIWGCLLGVIAAAVGFKLFVYFGVPRLWCHVIFCITAPLMVARGIWWVMRGTRMRGGLLALVGMMMIGTYYYARRIEPTALEINHNKIASEQLAKAGFKESLRVVILADIQTDDIGEYEDRVFAEVDALKPDLILLAGDYLQCKSHKEYEKQRTLLRALFNGAKHKPRFGTVAIYGNVDGDLSLFEGTDVVVLENDVHAITGAPLQILGLADSTSMHPLTQAHLDTVKSFEGLTFVMGHRPDFLLKIEKFGSDIEFVSTSGHTHGGQIVIPGVGAPVTLTNMPRKYVSGMHRMGKVWHCPSRGIGMERNDAPRIRLFCPPEIVVLEITATASKDS